MDRAGANSDERLAYWRGRLQDAPVIELPLDRPREGTTPDRMRADIPSRIVAPFAPFAGRVMFAVRPERSPSDTAAASRCSRVASVGTSAVTSEAESAAS